jgi:hypothetical protein
MKTIHRTPSNDEAAHPRIAEQRQKVARENRARRIKVGGVVAGATVAGVAWVTGTAHDKLEPTPIPQQTTADERVVCIPSAETMQFTFKSGDGRNAAILAIKGSGVGEGDPCWTEAGDAVDAALGETAATPGHPATEAHPLAIGETITIPQRVIEQ